MFRTWIRFVFVLAALLALTPSDGRESKKRDAEPERRPPRSAEELQIVDCLLPPQIRQLGKQTSYLSRRRPIRTTALDCGIRGGEYVAYDRANYETALHVWLASAEAGDAQAQYYVGEIYEQGLGTAPDPAKAADWYRKAAEQGFPQAQIGLGFLYEKGLGVRQDTRKALELYRKASGVSGTILLDGEIAAIESELREANAKLRETESRAEAIESELRAARSELERERVAGRQSTAELERRSAELTRRLELEQSQVASLRKARTRHDFAAPTIEIVDPFAVRSSTTAPAERASELAGRVVAPAGLASLLVEGEPLSVDNGGFFRFRPRSARVTLVATDLQGKQGVKVYDANAPAATPPPSKRPPKTGSYRALLVGNFEYAAFPALDSVDRDVSALAALLTDRFGFQVQVLRNATYMDLLTAMSVLRDELREEDSFLLYFAGHGEFDPASGLGYWLPVDAAKDKRTNWMSSREVGTHLGLLPSRHVLVIADSCYSAALTRSSLARPDDAEGKGRDTWLAAATARRSRTALTSGGLKPVLDTGGGGHSVFARSLLDTLDAARKPGVVEAYRLWSTVRARVMLETRAFRQEQKPEYAPIQHAGHEGGEFFFVPLRG